MAAFSCAHFAPKEMAQLEQPASLNERTALERHVARMAAADVLKGRQREGWGEIVEMQPLEVPGADRFWYLRCKRTSGIVLVARCGGTADRLLAAEGIEASMARYPIREGRVSIYAIEDGTGPAAELELAVPGLTDALTVRALVTLRLEGDPDDPDVQAAIRLLQPENADVLGRMVQEDLGRAQDTAMEYRASRGRVA